MDSAFILANITAMRRESVLSFLPPSYKAAAKMTLCQSPLELEFLFDSARVQEAVQVVNKVISGLFQQAGAGL